MIVMLGNALAYIQDKQQWSETQKIQILSQLKMETNAPKWSEESPFFLAQYLLWQTVS